MRKLLIPLLLILLSSCAVYTVGEGKANIHIPEVSGEPETRFRIISERREWERMSNEERAKAEELAEAERIEAEAEAERLKEEYLKATAVYEYPENLEELSLPHNYRPRREHLSLETEFTPLRLLFIPLENGAKLEKVASSVRDLETDFIFATGSIEQLVRLSEIMGRDSVLTEGGLVMYNTRLSEMDSTSASFMINDDKKIETVVLSTFTSLAENPDELLKDLSCVEDQGKILEGIPDDENTVIFAFSSAEPSGLDWIPFTAYPYRSERSFSGSTWFENNSYVDVYRATHYSAETDPGITRENGEIYERVDFIYVKNAIPLESETFSVAGMDNRAIYAEVLLP